MVPTTAKFSLSSEMKCTFGGGLRSFLKTRNEKTSPMPKNGTLRCHRMADNHEKQEYSRVYMGINVNGAGIKQPKLFWKFRFFDHQRLKSEVHGEGHTTIIVGNIGDNHRRQESNKLSRSIRIIFDGKNITFR